MGPKHDRQHILQEALALATSEGLRSVTFGRLAGRLGLPDRTIVYYFPTKAQLLREVLEAGTAELRDVLTRAFRAPAESPAKLVARAWPVVSSAEAEPVFRLFFDAVGLAMHDPHALGEVVRGLVTAWAASLEPLFEGTRAMRRARAEATVALLDGLLLVRFTAGPEASARAARALLAAEGR